MMVTIRLATEADLESILTIVETAVKNLADPSLFVPDDRDFFRRLFAGGGFVLLAEVDGRIAGYLAVTYPGKNADNLGWDLGFSENQLSRIAHMESAAVLPEFRGQGLQKQLMSEAEAFLPSGISYAMATVSPQNPASLNSMLRLGYTIEKTMQKYGGLERHIMVKRLPSSSTQ